MILANPSAESLIRFLAYLGGVASTLVGSWVSSKIHGYHENRKVHLEDIKQKVLSPLSRLPAAQTSQRLDLRLPPRNVKIADRQPCNLLLAE